jgi:hypothetical protein
MRAPVTLAMRHSGVVGVVSPFIRLFCAASAAAECVPDEDKKWKAIANAYGVDAWLSGVVGGSMILIINKSSPMY